MQQKVAIARGFLTAPVLMLLDEPTTGLDPRSKREVQQFVLELRDQHDATILLTTHDMDEADRLCDRIAILEKGKMIALDTPEALKARLAVERPSAIAGGRVHGANRPRARGGRARRRRRRRANLSPLTAFTVRDGGGDDMEGWMAVATTTLVREARAAYAFVERNYHLTRRYWGWEVVFLVYSLVSSLSILFLGASVQTENQQLAGQGLILYLLVGTLVWAYLGVVFDVIADMISWERWEGTIEYTFMAPITRATHLIGSCIFGVLYGFVRTGVILAVIALFFNIDLSHANFGGATVALLDRLGRVRRTGDNGVDAAATLHGAWRADDADRSGVAPARVGRLLPDQRAPGLDAGAGDDLPGDLRARGESAESSPGSGPRPAPPGALATGADRGRLHPARARDVRNRRAVREANGAAQAERVEVGKGSGAGPRLLGPAPRCCRLDVRSMCFWPAALMGPLAQAALPDCP